MVERDLGLPVLFTLIGVDDRRGPGLAHGAHDGARLFADDHPLGQGNESGHVVTVGTVRCMNTSSSDGFRSEMSMSSTQS